MLCTQLGCLVIQAEWAVRTIDYYCSVGNNQLSKLQLSEKLSKHQKPHSSTCKPGSFLDHTPLLVTYNFLQLSEHVTYSNTPWSQRVRITGFLLLFLI